MIGGSYYYGTSEAQTLADMIAIRANQSAGITDLFDEFLPSAQVAAMETVDEKTLQHEINKVTDLSEQTIGQLVERIGSMVTKMDTKTWVPVDKTPIHPTPPNIPPSGPKITAEPSPTDTPHPVKPEDYDAKTEELILKDVIKKHDPLITSGSTNSWMMAIGSGNPDAYGALAKGVYGKLAQAFLGWLLSVVADDIGLADIVKDTALFQWFTSNPKSTAYLKTQTGNIRLGRIHENDFKFMRLSASPSVRKALTAFNDPGGLDLGVFQGLFTTGSFGQSLI